MCLPKNPHPPVTTYTSVRILSINYIRPKLYFHFLLYYTIIKTNKYTNIIRNLEHVIKVLPFLLTACSCNCRLE
ncbi:hypothetical protein FPV045 [Fowlpox virus]|uniref:Uncharacterized protein FPV045 n=2 Tax=Fowlpox virus TaxID=10261 RepID=V045_FOWPN|nr:hypothetical protein FPV045 [Fowlpox virus]Q9J5F7.1 RecName: Full=Uncharacterized protein FPV045 [Fowlpox virus strain NVSL]UNS14236.1 ALPV-072 [Albatrosspox virus]WPD91008.1 hypothetical protein PPV-Vac110-fpv045 [Avipoxvirus sp.]CAE52592.1 hypothetical protein [Fowlpox virus isolate HP-438/Munich]AAF44389.1 ORF FPV045 hypothetical protein [Fowlpox virus]ART91480.1 hypothetical protein [Fowlpox virus]